MTRQHLTLSAVLASVLAFMFWRCWRGGQTRGYRKYRRSQVRPRAGRTAVMCLIGAVIQQARVITCTGADVKGCISERNLKGLTLIPSEPSSLVTSVAQQRCSSKINQRCPGRLRSRPSAELSEELNLSRNYLQHEFRTPFSVLNDVERQFPLKTWINEGLGSLGGGCSESLTSPPTCPGVDTSVYFDCG